jgi:hypothetical protein
MSKKGCGFLGGSCKPILDKCDGCERILKQADQNYCLSFPDPAAKWRLGACGMATHAKTESKGGETKVRVGQQKQKKK